MLTLYRRPVRMRTVASEPPDEPPTPEPAPSEDSPLMPEQPTEPERV